MGRHTHKRMGYSAAIFMKMPRLELVCDHLLVGVQSRFIQDRRAADLDVRIIDAVPEAIAHDLKPARTTGYCK